MSQLQKLLDYDDVCSVIRDFGRGLDLHDWALYRQTMTEHVEIDFSDLTGQPAKIVRADDWTRFAAACLDPVLAHHQSTNQHVMVEGGLAKARSYMLANHHRPGNRGDSSYIQLAWYDVELVRTADGWRVRRLKQKIHWCEGNPALIDVSTPEIVSAMQAVFGAGPASGALPQPISRIPEEDASIMQSRLQELVDKHDINQVMLTFGRALDTQDWPLYRSTFLDTFEVDFTDLTGQPPTTVDAALWTEFARLILGPVKTHHQYSNHAIALRGDEADGLLYHVSRHHRPNSRGASENHQYGWYENTYVRTGQGWKIKKLKHAMAWTDGNDRLLDTSAPELVAVMGQIFGPRN